MPDLTADDTWARRFNAYGALGVTLGLFLLFLTGMVVTALKGDTQSFATMVDRVGTMIGMAVMFWVGASRTGQENAEQAARSSAVKNETLATATAALAASVPVAAAPAVTTTKVAPDGTTTTTIAPVAAAPPPAVPAP